MKYQATQYDGYNDWNLAGALMILSIMSDRKLSLKIKQDTIYPNLNIICVADSTISRKSTGMKKCDDFNFLLLQRNKKLPNAGSPERFVEDMSNNPHAYAFKDEAAGFIASFQKSYMAEMRDLLMELYACGDYNRALRTGKSDKRTEFFIKEPFLNMWLMTVPENFIKYVTKLDVTSGWMLRFLFMCPTGPKPWMGFAETTDDDRKMYGDLYQLMRTRKEFIDKTVKLNAKLTPEAWIFYHNWQQNIDESIMKEANSSLKSSLYGRLQVYGLKLAMLFALGEKELNINVSASNIKEHELTITESEIVGACELIDTLFYPYAESMINRIEESREMLTVQKAKNFIHSVTVIDENTKKVTRAMQKSVLLRLMRCPANDLNTAVSHLIESDEIGVVVEDNITFYHTK